MPWRQGVTPYGVFVSEIMLQQTQVGRVMERCSRQATRTPSTLLGVNVLGAPWDDQLVEVEAIAICQQQNS